jgi:cyclic beta-1,2-glucan synthetase
VSAPAHEPALDALEAAARDLRARHVAVHARPRALPARERLAALEGWLDRARELLADPEPAAAKAAEWLLDNDYQVLRAQRQVAQDLTDGFYARLTGLAGEPERGLPRAFALAHGLLAASHMQLSLDAALRFVRAYQEGGTWLTIAELWAFPALLRLACLELLVTALARVVPELEPPFPPSPAAAGPGSLEDTECIARALSNLGVIASISWKDFFEGTSRVEAMLRRDPAGAYPHMDFETRDRYRKRVESLASGSPLGEAEVARRAVEHARGFLPGDARRAHVGQWLLGEGREPFERSLGYRLSVREKVERWLYGHAGPLYAGALALGTAAALAIPAAHLSASGASLPGWLLGIVFSLLPASLVGVTLVHFLITRIAPPRVLPKLDFEKGIPPEFATAVVVPALVSSPAEARELVERLEGHYLANPDPTLRFALLTDPLEGPAERMPGDEAIERTLIEEIRRANARQRPAEDAPGPFHVLHRHRRFNPAEGCWMGWERKRGKLEQLNQLVAGAEDAGFAFHEGDPASLRGLRFVVTVDADTRLPPGSVARLAGTLAHPLNRADFEEGGGALRSGYSVVQPRIEISPESGRRSLFARLYSGDTAIDIYTCAVSDVYQDLFGTGIYVGKGIYDVDAFARSLSGRVPENRLASHDLFEGLQGRAALASDIVLYESFPSRYEAFARRWHRWVRGDWQLVPWLGREVPGAEGVRLPNRLSTLGRWQILDNLRRSLIPASLIALLAAGWLILPGSAWFWSALAVASPVAYPFADLLTGLARGRRHGALRGGLRRLGEHAGRWLLDLVFLPQDAALSLDAALRTLWRVTVSGKHLLQWTSAAHVAAHLEGRASRAQVWGRLWVGPASAALLGAGLALLNPAALVPASPLLLLWLASPEVALFTGRRSRIGPEALDDPARAFLRGLARRTWLFFETFAGPDDHWLPPDNYQEHPHAEIAHRTSPTNVGMLLLSSLGAWDLGYVGLSELAARLRSCLDTLDRLDRDRGHLFNWYDTRSLAPLEPRYVSTVDSGNLAVSLVALKEGCRELAAGPALRRETWDGLADALRLLKSALGGLAPGSASAALRGRVERLEAEASAARDEPATWRAAWSRLDEEELPELDRLLVQAAHAAPPPLAALREIRTWLERAHHHVRGALRETEQIEPWQAVLAEPPPGCEALARELARVLAPGLRLAEATERCGRARALLAQAAAGEGTDARADAWRSALREALARGDAEARVLRDQLREIASRAEALAFGMDFRMLYDAETRRFRIGYNASADRLDGHHYDLLATEARLASFFAIAKGDAPVAHWFHLGRPITRTSSGIALLSWGGSLFEYLMPPLLLRSHPGTLLYESERIAVDAQRSFARELGMPWGVSESGYAAVDAHGHYRYHAFGVPALGLRRGLARDLVVAPYASALALPVRTHAALDNLRELERLGLCGAYGLLEAADFTPDRAPREGAQRFAPVRSWMAHHQGMTLAALANTLCGESLLRRFHADRRVRAVELLLHERVPRELTPEAGRAHERPEPEPRRAAVPAPGPWAPAGPDTTPRVHALGNGRLACWVTEAGSGGLRWHGRALTRWRPDATRDDRGLWIYVRDDESGAIWSAGRQPTGVRADEAHVVFHPHLAEFHRRDRGIALRLEVAVAPADDLEIRRLGIANESDRPRTLTFTSYAEVVLASPLDDERHPAFSKLFVGGEWLPELRGLLLGRRPRHPAERPPVLLHRVLSDAALPEPGFEVDRRAFLGRHGDPRRPRGVVEGVSGGAGFTLDPILALQVTVSLEPGERRELCFVTLAAASRESALELAERYATPAALDWAIADAAGEAARDVQRLGLEPSRLPELQALASLLLHPYSALRGSAASLVGNRLGQPRLWGLGLSGDLPILLLRAGDPSDGPLLPALVRGHELWQRRGLDVDLVVLRTGASGYVEPLREQLFGLLREVGAHGPLGRRGGVHLLFADQIQAEELRLLEAAAAVVLDDARGPLAQQLAAGARHAELPAFEPVGPPGPPVPSPPIARANDLLFDNGFGGFSPDGREYAIHLGPGESTPSAWCNVLANEGFGCLTSEAGLGFSWAENAGENRLTPWSNDPLLDSPGEVLFLRDEETAEIWTPTPRPAGDGTACEIRHGAGATTWRRASHGFEQELTVFVPIDAPVKIARLRLRNLARRTRRVTATYYAEWQLGALPSAACPHVTSSWQPNGPALLARSAWNPDFAGRVAFLTATRPPHGLAADRREFLGREGDLRRPAALLRWGLSDRVEPGADPCAAYQVHLDLGPEECVEVAFALGQGRDTAHAEELVQRWRDTETIERAYVELRRHWDHLLGALEVRTPEPSFDLMLNRWLLYQTVASRLLARAGFHQAGGAIGFRDQLQDSLALLHADPARVRAHLLVCAAHQFEEGDVLHWWHPPGDRGVRTRCSDDLLWLPWVASAYVEATGDASVLDEQVPFLRAPPLGPHEEARYSRFEPSGERRSLLEHCERALERGVTRGAHGLPLIGSGDWNDGMDRVGTRGRGESVWLAWFAISTMKRFAGLCERRARGDLAERWRQRAEELARAVEEAGWDGEWYLRAFDDDGRPYGSQRSDEARIDSIAQSWAVLSGAADPERARRALAAAERLLVREDDGVVRLLWPPLDETPRDPGYIKAYPPGVRENGGQYSHAAAWLAFAFAERGDGARTARLFALLNPVARTAKRADAERHRGEPYVLAADIGSVPPQLGRAGWTWYTGSAAWTWRLGVEAMLGLRLREGRLGVAPCLPPGWPGYEATLRGPAGALAVRVEVAPDLPPGRCEARCEGARVGDEGVAFPEDGSTRRVDVRVGGAPEGSG